MGDQPRTSPQLAGVLLYKLYLTPAVNRQPGFRREDS